MIGNVWDWSSIWVVNNTLFWLVLWNIWIIFSSGIWKKKQLTFCYSKGWLKHRPELAQKNNREATTTLGMNPYYYIHLFTVYILSRFWFSYCMNDMYLYPFLYTIRVKIYRYIHFIISTESKVFSQPSSRTLEVVTSASEHLLFARDLWGFWGFHRWVRIKSG